MARAHPQNRGWALGFVLQPSYHSVKHRSSYGFASPALTGLDVFVVHSVAGVVTPSALHGVAGNPQLHEAA